MLNFWLYFFKVINPKIAIAVYVENAGFGGDIAAPIASLMIEKYLNGSISQRKQYLEDRMINLKLINPEKDLLSSADIRK